MGNNPLSFLSRIAMDILAISASAIVLEYTLEQVKLCLMKINSSCSIYYKNMCLRERLKSRRYQTQRYENDNDQGDDDPWMLMDTSTSTG